MHMLYNSDSFTVVLFEIAGGGEAGKGGSRGAFEIVDKLAQKDIFIEGEMADRVQAGVQALLDGVDGPSEEDMDEYIGRFASLRPQPLVLH
ncbi:MAG: BTH_I0359 family protein [Caldimonas sp.]